MIDYTPTINQYYEAIQYQDASAAEIASWSGLLNGTTTVAEMQTAIINDPYTLNVVDPVIREYQAALGRIPDEAGITYWVGRVAANPAELGTLSVTFADSTEFSNDYRATASTPANTALVTDLYLNVLGRAPDASGLAYWVNSGLHAAQLLQAFAQSAEFVADATAPIAAFQTEISNNPTAPYPTGSLFSLPAPTSAYNVSANWKMAGMQSVGGIPNRTTVCATVRPRGSGLDDTSSIQSAINACPAGEVVSLSAGTFIVNDGNFVLLNKGITLRGAGPGVTTISRTNGCAPLSPKSNGNCGSNPSPEIIVGPEQYNNWLTSTNLTADVAQGAYSVQVTSASGFAVGQFVMLDQMSNASYQPDVGVGGTSKIWASSDYLVTWQKHNPSQGYDDFSSSQYPYQAGTAGCWFQTEEVGGVSRCDRTTSEIKRISAISGTTITFDSPITIPYHVANTAQLSYYQMPFTTYAGVEGLTLYGADDGALEFTTAAYSWAYRVECTVWLGHGCIQNFGTFRVQVEQFYVHDGAWPEPGGGGYAVSMCCGSSEILIENGISVRADKVVDSFQSGAGSVVAYNYMDQAFICCDSVNSANGSDYWIENGLNNSHYPGSHHMLFEGNLTHQMGEDETHGNSTHNTYFRNWSQGYRIPSWKNAYDGGTINDLTGAPLGSPAHIPVTPAETQLYTYWDAFVGNVLGYPGYSTSANGWVYSKPGGPAIFSLGAGYTSGNPGPDPKAGFDTNGAGGTTEAHGNYDYLQNAVTWDSNYSNHNLPNSFFLASEPAFFIGGTNCAYPWPWVTPTGSSPIQSNSCGGSGLPAKARFDAGTPFTQP